MLNDKRGRDKALALLLLAFFVVGCGALKNMGGKNATDEANKLISSANQDLKDAEKIADDNLEGKTREFTKAAAANKADEAEQVLDDSIKQIDEGLAKGESAANKFEQASKLDLNDTQKQYLTLQSQGVRKRVDAFKEFRKAVVVLRDNKGNLTKQKTRDDYMTALGNFKKLNSEADDLERKADGLARQNPDKIKPS
jgi:vacuolar-type H+-ATPase subunit H